MSMLLSGGVLSSLFHFHSYPIPFSSSPFFLLSCPLLSSRSSRIPGSAACISCPVGTWSREYHATCTPCAAGTYANTTGSSSRLNCPSGTTHTNTNTNTNTSSVPSFFPFFLPSFLSFFDHSSSHMSMLPSCGVLCFS
jgi:Tyrosine-protein kinase ephrin type A/B receptor-like